MFQQTEGSSCTDVGAGSTATVVSQQALAAQFVDFRDLLLPPIQSVALGGTGDMPYGDLFVEIKKILDEQVLNEDPITGVSGVNDLLIGPITESQSQTAGTLLLAGDLLNTNTRVEVGGLNARIELRLYDVSFVNVDTVKAPLSLLDPLRDLPYRLNNTASFGAPERPLRIRFSLVFGFSGGGTYDQ